MHILFKRFSTIVRATCYSFFMLCMFLTPALHSMPGMLGFENLSPEEMQMLEQELQAAAQQIDQYVSSLTPEEQAEFQKAVAEVEQMMSSMSEEELNQFFEQIIAAEMEQAQMQGMPPVQQPQQPVTFEQKPAAVVSKIPLTTAEEKALALLTSLIDTTDKFLVKTDNIPDMNLRFSRWASQNKLTGISATTTWEQEKNTIIDLRQQVSDLKKTDLKTGKYLFLEAFIKNTSLYNELEKLSKQLELNEPRIVVSSFGIEKLSDDAKAALQNALNAYGAGLQSTKTEIKKLFDEIGPELAKIKEEEKKTTEKAQTEAAKTRTVTPGRTAGSADHGGYYGGGRGEDYDFGGGYPYGKDSGYGDYGRPRAEGAPEKPAKDKDKGKKPHPGGKKDKKDEDKDKDKDEDKDAAKKEADKAKHEEKERKANEMPVTCPVDGGEQLNGKYELIASNYRYIADLLKENTAALDVATLLTKEPDAQLALYVFPSIERRVKRLNELVGEYLKQAGTLKNATQKTAALDKLAEFHSKQDALAMFTQQLNAVTETIMNEENGDTVIQSFNANARHAYFKNKLELTNKEIVLKQPNDKTKIDFAEKSLASLLDIQQQLEQLNTTMPKVSKKTAPKEQKEAQPQAPTRAQAVVE